MCDAKNLLRLTLLIRDKLQISTRSIIVGVAGAQGSGKSTLARDLATSLERFDVGTVVVSLDDFYLTKTQRSALAQKVHPLLGTRGVPGTHDVQLLGVVLNELIAEKRNLKISWPMFDKAEDDRGTQQNTYDSRLLPMKKAIILEGWCVGCSPLEDIEVPVNELERTQDPEGLWRKYIDSAIRSDYLGIWSMIDQFIFLEVPSSDCILKWRAEQALQNGEDVASFDVGRFFQYFERITRQMLRESAHMPRRTVIHLAEDHSVKGINIK